MKFTLFYKQKIYFYQQSEISNNKKSHKNIQNSILF